MKKTLFLILLITGIGNSMFAQSSSPMNEITTFSMYESRFNTVRPGYARILLAFRMPPSKTKIHLELTSLQQLNQLPNLDSLLGECLQAIKGIVDSTPIDNISRRIDAVPRDQKIELRTTSHESNQNTLVYQQGSLSNIKFEQDTLRIKFYTLNGNNLDLIRPGFISVQVNFLQELYHLPSHIMDSCIVLAKKNFTTELISGIRQKERLMAGFNVSQGIMTEPSVARLKKDGKKAYYNFRNNESTVIPAIYGSLQYVRGSIAPSFSAGLSYVISDNKQFDHRVYLMWEPYFFFSRENNVLKTDRNDFITFRKVDYEKPQNGGWSFVQNFSVGYLVGRRGNWFEPNTFKFSLPGVRNYTLQVEPEFYFNGFFKNFSPTLRFSLFFE